MSIVVEFLIAYRWYIAVGFGILMLFIASALYENYVELKQELEASRNARKMQT